ncbi:MAG: hypothetical protein ABUS57_08680 [Pseudomonadota bacterium]
MADVAARDPVTRPKRRRFGLDWFADLQFHWDGSITVRKSGRRITTKDLTLGELSKFFAYLGVLLVQATIVRLSGKRRYRVCFTPHRPEPWYVVWSAAALAGVDFVRSPWQADVVFYFEDVTTGSPPRLAGRRLLNAGVADISKTRVATVFELVAGYPLLLDPSVHNGQAVEKSEANGAHDGRLVQCPTRALPGKSYQCFVDSSEGEEALDFRTTIINRKPCFVLVKTKPAGDRFSIHNTTVRLVSLQDAFTSEEIDLIGRFAREMELDWGAIDVLRDRGSGRIYIVDVNKTDTGPAVDLSFKDREILKREIARAFRAMIEARARGSER